MVAIDVGNVYITTGSISGNTITGGTTVKIHSTKIDYNLDNAIIAIAIPVSKGNRGETPYARIVDLKRIKELIAVQGFLIEETPTRAITKRNNLIALSKTGNALSVVWGQGNYQTVWKPGTSPYGIFIQKFQITEVAGQIGEGFTGDPPPERSLAINITLIRGKDM